MLAVVQDEKCTNLKGRISLETCTEVKPVSLYDTHSTHCYIKTSSGKLMICFALCSRLFNFFCEYAHLHCSLVISSSHRHIHVDLWVGQRFGDWTMYLLHALLPSFLLPPLFLPLSLPSPPPSVSPEHQIQDVWIRHPDRR